MLRTSLKISEKILLIMAVTFFPVLFQLLGTAILGSLFPSASAQLLFIGERLAFFTVVLFITAFLFYLKVITIKLTSFSISIIVAYVLVLASFYVGVLTFKPNETLFVTFYVVSINLFIAFEEELLYRFLLPSLLDIFFSSVILIGVIQALLFAFMGHLDGFWLTNLVIRFPLGFLLYSLFKKTKRLIFPVVIHCLWNLVLIYL